MNAQIEHLQSKHIGTGHPDITKHEWASNQARDSINSYLGHSNLLDYMAIAQNQSIGRTRAQLLDKMFMPCGQPPAPTQIQILLQKKD